MALRPDDEALLLTYTGPEPERVRRAIVSLAGGRGDELRTLVTAAQTDYRDVLCWEQQEHEGRPGAPVDGELLVAWLQQPPRPAPAPSSRTSVVLLDAGPKTAELTKAVRRVSGQGLADVAALVAQVPVTIVDGLGRDDAEALQAQLHALGARVELR